jgi:predicted porin
MKKTLIALAAFAATGAFAQSSVSVYGAVDAAYTNYASEGVSKSGLGNSQLGSSKLGFSGVEDLGNGLKANFKLEGGLANDSGIGKATNTSNQAGGTGNGGAGAFTSVGGTQGLVFARYSYVGLSGGFGEVRLGRDYTSAFQLGVASADPFGTNGPASSSDMTLNLGSRNGLATTSGASNMIGYITPSMNGVSAKLQAFFGENSSASTAKAAVGGTNNSTDGDGYSAQIGYTSGPIFASFGQQVTKGTAATAVNAVLNTTTGAGLATSTGIPAATGDYTQRGLSLTYDLGVAKLAYTNAREELIGTAATATNASNLVGVTVPFKGVNYKASYVRSVQNTGVAAAVDNVGTLVGVGADYALSKRTTLYTTYSRVSNENGRAFSAGLAGGAAGSTLTSTENPSSTGLAIGVFHSF